MSESRHYTIEHLITRLDRCKQLEKDMSDPRDLLFELAEDMLAVILDMYAESMTPALSGRE